MSDGRSDKAAVQQKVSELRSMSLIAEAFAILEERLPADLTYHSSAHTEDVFREAVALALHDGCSDREVELVAIAAAFHDAGYIQSRSNNEAIGAAMAAAAMQRTGGYTIDEICLVEEMILDTRVVDSDTLQAQVASTRLSAYLLDADLCNFGRDDFFEKLDQVRGESGADELTQARATLEMMERHHWLTGAARLLRDEKKQQNMAALRERLKEHKRTPRGAVAMLSIRRPDHPPEEIPLYEDTVTRVGRARTNEIVIAHPSASRFHAVFNASFSGVVLSDLASLNGTFVNEQRVASPRYLTGGERIRIADVDIVVSRPLYPIQSSDPESSTTLASKMLAIFVTVLVADVCNYTKLSQLLPAQDVAGALGRWFERVAEIVRSHGGTVDKYIGDGVMALWHGSDKAACAEAAVRAGVAIAQEAERFSSGTWAHSSTIPWRCRVALNSGEALMGTLGQDNVREFTVLGDTINLVFRLEDVAGLLSREVVLGERTAELVRHALALEELPVADVSVPEIHRVYAPAQKPP